MKKLWITLLSMLAVLTLSGCTDADIASHNISRKSDFFEIPNQIFLKFLVELYSIMV